MTVFIALGIVLILAAAALVVVPLLRGGPDQSAPIAATVTALLIPAVAVLIYLVSSNYSWQPGMRQPPPAAEAGNTGDGAGTARSMTEAVAGLEARLVDEPEDLDGWLLLGNAYLQMQRSADAERAFGNAMALTGGENLVAKLGVAEAQIQASRESLGGSAGELVEEVLAVEPDNQKALFYGGLAAAARDDGATFKARWERLLSLNPPETVRRVVSEQLQAMGVEVAAAPPVSPAAAPSTASTAAAGGIEVQISIADELAGQVRDGALLFLVARDENQPGPPVAAIRVPVGALPRTLQITDANAMIPGRSLSALSRVKLIARVSNGGDALAQPGDIFGELTWNSGDGPVAIVMNQVVGR